MGINKGVLKMQKIPPENQVVTKLGKAIKKEYLYDMNNAAKKRVAIYARVSTLEKGQDPETQLRQLREYVARRNGYNGPGLIVYLNNSNSWLERWVPTNWYNTQIKDFTGHSNWYPTTQGGGWVKIQCPPKSYTVWSPNI